MSDPAVPQEPPAALHVRLRKALGRVRRRFNVDRFHVFVRPVPEGDTPFEGPQGYRFSWGTPEGSCAKGVRANSR